MLSVQVTFKLIKATQDQSRDARLPVVGLASLLHEGRRHRERLERGWQGAESDTLRSNADAAFMSPLLR